MYCGFLDELPLSPFELICKFSINRGIFLVDEHEVGNKFICKMVCIQLDWVELSAICMTTGIEKQVNWGWAVEHVLEVVVLHFEDFICIDRFVNLWISQIVMRYPHSGQNSEKNSWWIISNLIIWSRWLLSNEDEPQFQYVDVDYKESLIVPRVLLLFSLPMNSIKSHILFSAGNNGKHLSFVHVPLVLISLTVNFDFRVLKISRKQKCSARR